MKCSRATAIGCCNKKYHQFRVRSVCGESFVSKRARKFSKSFAHSPNEIPPLPTDFQARGFFGLRQLLLVAKFGSVQHPKSETGYDLKLLLGADCGFNSTKANNATKTAGTAMHPVAPLPRVVALFLPARTAELPP